MTLFVGISELAQPWPDEGTSTSPIDVIRDAALRVERGVVTTAGARADVQPMPKEEVIDLGGLGGRAVIPGFVDSHTHLVWADDRANNRIDEFALRARGATYEEIALCGGGIAASVRALAAASEDELFAQAHKRLYRALARGVTTCEVKTGYGLSPELEARQLTVIARLHTTGPVTVVATVLAHLVPEAYRDRRAEYVSLFCEQVLPRARALGAAFCDVFVERGAFTTDEATAIASTARREGLGLKLHVDQLSPGDGAALAARLGAISADHLEHTSPDGMKALAAAGTVATILPGCALFLGRGPWPRGRALRDAGCAVAVATDFNPGSSMLCDPALCATLAATQCGLSVEEALWGVTRGGALALDLRDRGCLRAGERADFLVLDHSDFRAALYYAGHAPVHQTFIAGRIASQAAR